MADPGPNDSCRYDDDRMNTTESPPDHAGRDAQCSAHERSSDEFARLRVSWFDAQAEIPIEMARQSREKSLDLFAVEGLWTT